MNLWVEVHYVSVLYYWIGGLHYKTKKGPGDVIHITACAYPKKLIKAETINYKKMFEVTVIILLQMSLFINSNI